jgi:hypothetical protein
MPITVAAARGVLTAVGEGEILPRLTAALLEASGLPSLRPPPMSSTG